MKPPDRPRERFQLVIEDAGKPGDVPTVNRLRSFLKSALRAYKLRCRSIHPDPDRDQQPLPTEAKNVPSES